MKEKNLNYHKSTFAGGKIFKFIKSTKFWYFLFPKTSMRSIRLNFSIKLYDEDRLYKSLKLKVESSFYLKEFQEIRGFGFATKINDQQWNELNNEIKNLLKKLKNYTLFSNALKTLFI